MNETRTWNEAKITEMLRDAKGTKGGFDLFTTPGRGLGKMILDVAKANGHEVICTEDAVEAIKAVKNAHGQYVMYTERISDGYDHKVMCNKIHVEWVA